MAKTVGERVSSSIKEKIAIHKAQKDLAFGELQDFRNALKDELLKAAKLGWNTGLSTDDKSRFDHEIKHAYNSGN